MSKNKKKNNKNTKKFRKVKILPIIISTIVIIGIVFCIINTSPVSRKSEEIILKIDEGSSVRSVTEILKKEGLIRNKYFSLIYIKLNNITGLQAGNYSLNKNMSLKEIYNQLKEGSNIKDKTITITFPEGKTMRKMAKIIEEKTINSYDDVFNVLSDKEYIQSLIDKYWFLDSIILNENIYYPLEGYLSPNTYEFKADATVKDIFEKMLNETDNVLTKYKKEIESSNYNIHEIVTLASMVEGEGVTLDDRKNIAGVFINRLNSGMSLGSDVTTYYALKLELGDRDLYKSEINSDNAYNTRSASNAGKLPIGPICNPSKEAIIAVINYTPNEYLYFVADKNMKVYFTKTDAEHNKTVNELKSKGLWYEY